MDSVISPSQAAPQQLCTRTCTQAARRNFEEHVARFNFKGVTLIVFTATGSHGFSHQSMKGSE